MSHPDFDESTPIVWKQTYSVGDLIVWDDTGVPDRVYGQVEEVCLREHDSPTYQVLWFDPFLLC